MTQALAPKVLEIKTKYADNKDLQNQMTALLYQETKVGAGSSHHQTHLSSTSWQCIPKSKIKCTTLFCEEGHHTNSIPTKLWG